MDNQKLQSSDQTQIGIPEEWKERFLIKRIDEEDIEISLSERDSILKALNAGQRFVQVDKYTIMLNAIKSIDPVYEPDNIPPFPTLESEIEGGVAVPTSHYLKLKKLWLSLYDKKTTMKLGDVDLVERVLLNNGR